MYFRGWRVAYDFKRKLEWLLPDYPVVQKRPLRWADRIYWLLRQLPFVRKNLFALGLTLLKGIMMIPHGAWHE